MHSLHKHLYGRVTIAVNMYIKLLVRTRLGSIHGDAVHFSDAGKQRNALKETFHLFLTMTDIYTCFQNKHCQSDSSDDD